MHECSHDDVINESPNGVLLIRRTEGVEFNYERHANARSPLNSLINLGWWSRDRSTCNRVTSSLVPSKLREFVESVQPRSILRGVENLPKC